MHNNQAHNRLGTDARQTNALAMQQNALNESMIIHRHACGEGGIFVNAYLIETPNGVVAVDATLSESESKAFRAEFEALKKPLLAVLITHPHPDHVAGITNLVAADTPQIVATQAVSELMRALEEPKRKQWGPVYGEEWVARWTYPNTIVVQDKVPPGAAAVVLNKSHTYTDIYLPIDARQKQLFDAIDGKRTIAEIAPQVALRDAARVLFEGLWWYDQIVFDASSHGGRGSNRATSP